MAGYADACSKTGRPITGRRSDAHSLMIKDAPRWPPPKGQGTRPSDAEIRPIGCSLSASRPATREAPLS
eukprot:8114614-Pyramimonas_sp.AAC.1